MVNAAYNIKFAIFLYLRPKLPKFRPAWDLKKKNFVPIIS